MAHSKIQAERRVLLSWLSMGAALGLVEGCSSTVELKKSHRPTPSVARNSKEYRLDAAKHLYQANSGQIYKGKLPPLLYAIGVIRVDISANGELISLDWMRKPLHATEVIDAIEMKIREASPFPAPLHLGHVTYTETWLWHKTGRFQLDTLTEGQT
jgi:periplasmic protein TonB